MLDFVFQNVDAAGPEITTAPVITTAKIGAPIAFTPAVTDGTEDTLDYELRIDGQLVDIAANLTAAQDQTTAVLTAIAASATGTSTDDSVGVQVTFNQPTAGALADIVGTIGDPIDPISVRNAFSVEGDPTNASLSIILETGTLQAALAFDGDDIDGTPSAANVTALVWRATNSGGSVTVTNNHAISELGVTVENITINTQVASPFIVALAGLAGGENGDATYTEQAALPNGVTLTGSNLSFDPDAVGIQTDLTIDIERDDDGPSEILRIVYTSSEIDVTFAGSAAVIGDIGAQTPDATVINFGDDSITVGEVRALAANTGALIDVGAISVDGGILEAGEETVSDQDPVYAYREGETVALALAWEDANGTIAGETGLTYIGNGTEATTVARRATVTGGETGLSNALPVASGAVPGSTLLWNDSRYRITGFTDTRQFLRLFRLRIPAVTAQNIIDGEIAADWMLEGPIQMGRNTDGVWDFDILGSLSPNYASDFPAGQETLLTVAVAIDRDNDANTNMHLNINGTWSIVSITRNSAAGNVEQNSRVGATNGGQLGPRVELSSYYLGHNAVPDEDGTPGAFLAWRNACCNADGTLKDIGPAGVAGGITPGIYVDDDGWANLTNNGADSGVNVLKNGGNDIVISAGGF
ncbi:MAG: hypothetical protein AAFX07_00515 [Pseudomonadota bacterium]